jgi:hypothetical protein
MAHIMVVCRQYVENGNVLCERIFCFIAEFTRVSIAPGALVTESEYIGYVPSCTDDNVLSTARRRWKCCITVFAMHENKFDYKQIWYLLFLAHDLIVPNNASKLIIFFTSIIFIITAPKLQLKSEDMLPYAATRWQYAEKVKTSLTSMDMRFLSKRNFSDFQIEQQFFNLQPQNLLINAIYTLVFMYR